MRTLTFLFLSAITFSDLYAQVGCIDSKMNSFGLVDFSHSKDDLREIFGKPDEVSFEFPIGPDTTVTVFNLTKLKRKGQKQKKWKSPKLIIQESGGQTLSMQILGYGSKEALNFCGLKLGDSGESIIEKLGEPDEIVSVNEADIRGHSYQYKNKKVLIFETDNVVVSINVSK
jgi:hypothetical protein